MSDSKTIDDGGPAFPIVTTETNEHGLVFPFVTPGVSRREWFAGQALASYLANPEGWRAKPDIIARDCYAIADAFIARGKAGAA
jgi:hypothetical protein